MKELEYEINYKCHYSEVYKTLQGDCARDKAQILYNEWNVKQERDWTKATNEELLKEANRRYPIGTKYYCCNVADFYAGKIGKALRQASSSSANRIEVGFGYVYYNGKWAEIISEEDTQLQDSCFNPSNNSGTITMNYTKSESKRLLLEIDDEELPMVPIIYSKTVDIMTVD